MRGFFEDDARFEALKLELAKWENTPFRPRMAQPGVGCDCGRFAHACYMNVGAMPDMDWPNYVTRGGGETILQLLRSTIMAIRGVSPVWTEGSSGNPVEIVKRGDMLIISSGKALHHVIVVEEPPAVWHCFERVQRGNLMDSVVINHLKNIFRIYA